MFKAPASPRESGRALLAVVVLLAVAICGTVVWYVSSGSGGTTPATGDGDTESAEVSDDTPKSVDFPEGDATPVADTTETHSDTMPTPGETAETESRIYGRVSNSKNEPLSGAVVRWVPTVDPDLKEWLHNPNLGDDVPPDSADSELMEAWKRSLSATADADGLYSITAPKDLEFTHGTVIASHDGHTRGLRELMRRFDKPQDIARSTTRPNEEVASSMTMTRKIDFTLSGAGGVSGTVTDRASGEPAVGVVVRASPVDANANPFMAAFALNEAPSTVVREDGSYGIVGLEAGEYRIVPVGGSTNYVSMRLEQGTKVIVEAGGELTGVDFELDRGVFVHGYARNDEGDGVPDVNCVIMPTDFGQEAMQGNMGAMAALGEYATETAADGYFEFRGVAAGKTYRVFGGTDDFAPASSEIIDLREDVSEVETELLLVEGSSIYGIVVTGEGEPIPGIEVNIVPDLAKVMTGDFIAAALARTESETDENGEFVLRHLPAGDIDLHAGALEPQEMFSGAVETQSVTVDGVNDIRDVRLVVANVELGAISGTVTNDLGDPVAGATVAASERGGFMGNIQVKGQGRSDESGNFVINDLQGSEFDLRVTCKGHTDTKVDKVALHAEGVRIAVSRNGLVSGKVVKADGTPVAGGTVQSRLVELETPSIFEQIASFMDDESSRAAIGEDGTFSIESPAGLAEIVVKVPGFATGYSAPLEMSPGMERDGIEITVTEGASIAGRVTFGGNTGVEGASISFHRKKDDATDFMVQFMPAFFGAGTAQTDDEGHYELTNLEPGEYVVSASHNDFAPSDPVTVVVKVDEGRTAPSLVLSDGGTINGTVMDGDNPKAGVMAQLIGGPGMPQTAMVGADGKFRFDKLRDGDYLVQITDMSGFQAGRMLVKMEKATVAGGVSPDLVVEFGGGHKIHGTVEGLPAAPMRMIQIRRPGGMGPEEFNPLDMQASVEANAFNAGVGMITPDGKYVIEGVPPGRYIIEVLRMPEDMTDMAAYATMDLTPHYRAEIEVKEKDLEYDIKIW